MSGNVSYNKVQVSREIPPKTQQQASKNGLPFFSLFLVPDSVLGRGTSDKNKNAIPHPYRDDLRNGLRLTFYEFRKRETPKLVFYPTYKEWPEVVFYNVGISPGYIFQNTTEKDHGFQNLRTPLHSLYNVGKKVRCVFKINIILNSNSEILFEASYLETLERYKWSIISQKQCDNFPTLNN